MPIDPAVTGGRAWASGSRGRDAGDVMVATGPTTEEQAEGRNATKLCGCAERGSEPPAPSVRSASATKRVGPPPDI